MFSLKLYEQHVSVAFAVSQLRTLIKVSLIKDAHIVPVHYAAKCVGALCSYDVS